MHRRYFIAALSSTLALSLALFLVHCSESSSEGPECTDSLDCKPGEICDFRSDCVPDDTGTDCAVDGDCNPSFECIDGKCAPRSGDADSDTDVDTDADTDVDSDSDVDTDTELCGDGRLPCRGTCCGPAEVCLYGACIAPGESCEHNAECEDGEYCETTLGKCLPDDPNRTCEYVPPVGQFNPEVLAHGHDLACELIDVFAIDRISRLVAERFTRDFEQNTRPARLRCRLGHL